MPVSGSTTRANPEPERAPNDEAEGAARTKTKEGDTNRGRTNLGAPEARELPNGAQNALPRQSLVHRRLRTLTHYCCVLLKSMFPLVIH
jgi:hypothetical protein